MMRKRDKAILDDLQRFRCMTRDDIIDLHFSRLSNPVGACNNVMKRLRRDGYVEVNMDYHPYLYFCSPAPIKRDSAKIRHFLAILDFYKQLRTYQEPKQMIIEPKYGKEYMEPDMFVIWKGAPFFVEIQCSQYSEKVMSAKLKRYEDYYASGEWRSEPWQPKDKRVFPYVWIVAPTRYAIHTELKVFQSTSVLEFLKNVS